MGTIQWRYTGSDGTQRLWHIPQRRPHRRCRAGRASWNAVRAIQTRGARPKISRMGFARNRPRPHYAPGFDAAPHWRTADPGTHRSNQSLLLQLKRRSRASATGLPGAPEGRSATARPARLPRDVSHGAHSRPRRRGNRRSRWSRSTPGASGRSRLCIRHAAMRRLLSVPAWARGHVPVSRPPGPPAIWFPSPTCATARPFTRTRTSADWPS